MAHGETCTAYIASIDKETLNSVLAQESQGHSKRGPIANDLQLAEFQAETLNNQMMQRVVQALGHTDYLSLGPGLEYPICSSF